MTPGPAQRSLRGQLHAEGGRGIGQREVHRRRRHRWHLWAAAAAAASATANDSIRRACGVR
eukprot:309339-Chlamydomonas_euryale.AAC.1